MIKILPIALTIFFSTDALAWSIFEPKNFDECILENMKGVTSDIAANAIGKSCAAKYPKKTEQKCKLTEAKPWDLSKITGTGSFTDIGEPYFSANLYNGMDKSIEEITVIISGENIKQPQEYKLFLQYPISPKSSGSPGISIQSFPGNKFKWDITSVKVCE
jgi:hypothetical protein